mmetsp:Transcript_21449/g.59421  ORF Transcript_21449/g.59421 Transcript_21449/m.59421 type:complete len:211 (-) Transcript_21449:550-1182(-)
MVSGQKGRHLQIRQLAQRPSSSNSSRPLPQQTRRLPSGSARLYPCTSLETSSRPESLQALKSTSSSRMRACLLPPARSKPSSSRSRGKPRQPQRRSTQMGAGQAAGLQPPMGPPGPAAPLPRLLQQLQAGGLRSQGVLQSQGVTRKRQGLAVGHQGGCCWRRAYRCWTRARCASTTLCGRSRRASCVISSSAPAASRACGCLASRHTPWC